MITKCLSATEDGLQASPILMTFIIQNFSRNDQIRKGSIIPQFEVA
jgi:hypothetical protein